MSKKTQSSRIFRSRRLIAAYFKANLQSPWFVTGLIFIILSISVALLVSHITMLRIALFPALVFLLSAIYSFYRNGHNAKRPSDEQLVTRGVWHEALRVSMWILAILGYLLWGLNGGWLYAGSILLGAALLENLSDWLILKRRKT